MTIWHRLITLPLSEKRFFLPPDMFLRFLGLKHVARQDDDVYIFRLTFVYSWIVSFFVFLALFLIYGLGITFLSSAINGSVSCYSFLRTVGFTSALFVYVMVFPYIFLISLRNIDPLRSNPQRLLKIDNPNKRDLFFRDLKYGIALLSILCFFSYGVYAFFLPRSLLGAPIDSVLPVVFLGGLFTALVQGFVAFLIVFLSFMLWQQNAKRGQS